MSPKIDVRTPQQIVASNSSHRLARLEQTGETFFLWDYSLAAG
jgi:hypothetical protein